MGLSESEPIPPRFLSPVYCQHDGHSRTIVGYETNSAGKFNILFFDPSAVGTDLKQKLQCKGRWQSSVKRQLSAMYSSDYEVLWVAGIMSEKEKAFSKACIYTYEDAPIDHEISPASTRPEICFREEEEEEEEEDLKLKEILELSKSVM